MTTNTPVCPKHWFGCPTTGPRSPKPPKFGCLAAAARRTFFLVERTVRDLVRRGELDPSVLPQHRPRTRDERCLRALALVELLERHAHHDVFGRELDEAEQIAARLYLGVDVSIDGADHGGEPISGVFPASTFGAFTFSVVDDRAAKQAA